MTKKIKTIILVVTSVALLIYWGALAVTNTKYQLINYWWQAFLAVAAVLYGIFGLLSAKHWSWLKSGVGKSVFSISIGLILWGFGQAVWTYYVIKYPQQQSPTTHLMDVLYFSSLPLWAYGIFILSKASGARYGLKGRWPKIFVIVMSLVMLIVSYVILVNVARGGTIYFHEGKSFWDIFFDLGYAVGDVVNLIMVMTIYALSWRYLGGRFKLPIILILVAFVLLYVADFWYSYLNAQNTYYNGDWVDLTYLLTIATFGLGLCLLDPSDIREATNLSDHLVSSSSNPNITDTSTFDGGQT